ncbi:shugoshin 2 [Phascolarctos cinereus]|uniref:Shugoshin 2 n=1 Tax=Phascolarctos cinereus TaxID=38626 RepID=A0A6P5K7A4_PHACI|nr:shugoshin 2 [Phascolarctos cinereus]
MTKHSRLTAGCHRGTTEATSSPKYKQANATSLTDTRPPPTLPASEPRPPKTAGFTQTPRPRTLGGGHSGPFRPTQTLEPTQRPSPRPQIPSPECDWLTAWRVQTAVKFENPKEALEPEPEPRREPGALLPASWPLLGLRSPGTGAEGRVKSWGRGRGRPRSILPSVPRARPGPGPPRFRCSLAALPWYSRATFLRTGHGGRSLAAADLACPPLFCRPQRGATNSAMFASEMEDLNTSATSLFFTQRIKRHVKDKKSSRVNKLNTSLASKIKNKIINNSSIIKISLKHNNRALAQALSIEKENSRKLTTEKMMLHKEVEKLSFRNAFLRQKLNHLHKTLIETEAFVSSNLISAIEMTSHPEDYQSPSLLPASQKKGIGNQVDLLHHSFGREIPHVRPTHLPMRVLLTAADDDDDDGDEKETFQNDSNLTTKKVPDSLTPVATKVSLSNQFHLGLSQSPEKNNQDVDAQDNPGRNFSVTNVLSTENQTYPEESSSVSELNNLQYVGQEKKKRSRSNSQSGNVTERKKRLPSWESSNFPAAIPLAVDLEQIVVSNNVLNQSSKINDNSIAIDTKTQQNGLCLDSQSQSVSELNAEFPTVVLPRDEQQLHKTIYEADMDLTVSEISKIVAVQTGAKNKSNRKAKSSRNKAFRKVKDSSSEKNREKSKVQPKTSSCLHSEERDKDTEESSSLPLAESSKSEDQKLTLETKQLAQLNTLKNVTFQKASEQNVVQISQHHDKKNKVRKTYVVNDEERVSLFPTMSSKSHQDSNCGMGHSFQTFDKGRDFRRTFVVDNSNKDTCFPSQKDNETVCCILEDNLQTVLNCTNSSQSLSDCRTQNSLDVEKQITHVQPSKQSTTNLSKKSLKYSRKGKTYELLSEVNQLHENNDKVVYHKESHMEDLNSEINKPEKNTEYQVNNINNASYVEVISKKMENYDLQKWDKKYSKNSSGKPMSLMIKSKPKTFMQPADLTQYSVPSESGLKHSMRELESGPESQNEHQKGQTQSTTTTLNKKTSPSSFMKVAAESELHVKVSNKRRESKSKKSRKTYVVAPINQNEVREKIPETVEERLVLCDSEQVNQEQNLKNEKISVKIKPDRFIFNPVMENSSCPLKSLAQVDSSNTRRFSPYTTLKEGLLNSDIPIAKDQKLPGNVTLKEPIFQVADTEQKHAFQEKTEGTIFQVGRRTETIGKDTKVLQDLTNASFVSHNSSSKSQSALDEVSSVLPTKRRRVAVCYKEPSLMRKLRREDEFANSDFLDSKPKKSRERKKKEAKENSQEIL